MIPHLLKKCAYQRRYPFSDFGDAKRGVQKIVFFSSLMSFLVFSRRIAEKAIEEDVFGQLIERNPARR